MRVSARPSVLLDSEPHLCVLRLGIISIFAIESLVLLILACSSIACRNNPSGLVGCDPRDREQPLELVYRLLRRSILGRL
jgi:hypothetical protein